MNVQVYLGGTDITHYTVQYNREAKICTGVGSLELSLSRNFTGTINTWNTITIYEEGSLAGTYNVSTVSYDDPEYRINITAQDDSKRLQDYFISQQYTIKYISTNIYWIEKFLTEVGISYEIELGAPSTYINEDTVIGPINAYEEIVQLLQMGGLYMHFTANNTCKIGHLDKDLSDPDAYYNAYDVLSLKTSKDDKMMRNRAVVWGKGDPSSKYWIFADVLKHTAWDYGPKDKRAVVLANSAIPSRGVAYSIANKMLDEFARITFTKDLTIHGARGREIGDIVFINTPVFSGSGLVTTAGVQMDKSGLITHLILDERCPRLFDYFGLKDYVYVGMNGEGVWRKKIEEWTWEDYSTGLTDLTITDLYKNNGILSCVTASGLLFRRNEFASTWTQIPITELPVTVSGEETIISEGLKVRSVTQDRQTNHIHAIVDSSDRPNRREYGATLSGLIDDMVDYQSEYAWVVDVNPYDGAIVDSSEITLSGEQLAGLVPSGATIIHALGFDIDNDGKNDYVSTFVIGSGVSRLIEHENGQPNFGVNDHQYWNSGDALSISFLNNEVETGEITGTGNPVGDIVCTFDNYDDRGIIYCENILVEGGGSISRFYLKRRNTANDGWQADATLDIDPYNHCIGIKRLSKNVFRVILKIDTTGLKFYELDFNAMEVTEGNSLTFSVQGTGTIQETVISYSTRSGDYIYGLQSEFPSSTNVTLYGLKVDLAAGTVEYTAKLYDAGSSDWQTMATIGLRGGTQEWVGRNFWHNGDEGCNIKIGVLIGNYTRTWEGAAWRYRCVSMDLTLLTVLGTAFAINTETTNIPVNKNLNALEIPTRSISVGLYVAVNNNAGSLHNSYYNRVTIIGSFKVSVAVGTVTSAYPYEYDHSHDLGSVSTFTIPEFGTELIEYTYVKNGNTSHRLYKLADQTSYIELEIPAGYTVDMLCNKLDSITHNLFVWGKRNSDNKWGLLEYTQAGAFVKFRALAVTGETSGNYAVRLSTNWIIVTSNYFPTYEALAIHYVVNDSDPIIGGGANAYCVLKREDDNYTVVWSGLYNYERLDLSGSNPLAIVPSGEWGMGLVDTSESGLRMSDSLDQTLINDFRYTNIATETGTMMEFYYNKGTEMLSLDISSIDNVDWSGTVVEITTSSGVMGKIETTNHQLPFQYVFVSNEPVSGGYGFSKFYQTDPLSGIDSIIEVSDNLPSGLINIIRVDDRL